MSAISPLAEPVDEAFIDALDVLRRKNRLARLVDVFVEAGITEATGYRRIKKVGDINLGEMIMISRTFGPPVAVLAQGDFATLQWLKEHDEAGPDDDPGIPSLAERRAQRDQEEAATDGYVHSASEQQAA